GSVQFRVDGIDFGPAVALSAGVATFQDTARFAAGPHVVSALYTNTDGRFAGSLGVLDGGLTVEKAAATVTIDTASLTPTYDGSSHAATATVSGATGTSSITFTYNGSSAAPTKAGSYTVVATLVNDNYQGSDTRAMIISPRGLTVSGITAADRPYDG